MKLILTLILENHASTCGFHSRCLETWLHWNNRISIDNLKVDVIVIETLFFVNLKLHSLNDIIFFIHKYCIILHYSLWQYTFDQMLYVYLVNWLIIISIAMLYVYFVAIIFIDLCMLAGIQNIIQLLSININKNILGNIKIWIFLSN